MLNVKKQDNIGVSPLKQKGNLISDSKGKADILVEQFQSVFTQVNDSILPDLSNNKKIPPMRNTIIESKGVEKLLSNLKHPKQWDQTLSLTLFSNLVLVNSRLVLAAYFSTSWIPDWCDANISPIFKKGDRHQAENYLSS